MLYCGGYLWLPGTVSKRADAVPETILPQITAQQYPIHLARVTENHLVVKRSQSKVEANGS